MRALDWSRRGVGALDERERHLDDIESTKKTALDPYATFRSLYRQHRASQIETSRNDNRATIPVWFPQSATRVLSYPRPVRRPMTEAQACPTAATFLSLQRDPLGHRCAVVRLWPDRPRIRSNDDACQ